MTVTRHLVVVSWYDQRSIEPLHELLASVDAHAAGCPFDLALVVNRGAGDAPPLPDRAGLRVLERENRGMNIGAWDHGWRSLPGYDGYLFLQDECSIVRDGWLAAFAASAGRDLALIGESLNTAWARPWHVLHATVGTTPLREHSLRGQPANRVDIYKDFMHRAGIDPGGDGAHLRSLVWFATRATLERIGGFPQGADFGECIGAEIGVSRQVIALGGRIGQVAAEPFHYIRHREWRQWVPDGPFHHGDPPPGWRPPVRVGGWRGVARRIVRRVNAWAGR